MENQKREKSTSQSKLVHCIVRLSAHLRARFFVGSSFQPSSLPECIPMTSHDVISSLNEHLLHVLGVEKGRSQECEEMRVVLEKYQLKFSVIIDQLVG